MIGGATLPNAVMPAPAHESKTANVQADAGHEPHASMQHHDHDTETATQADRTTAHEEHASQATSHPQRAARRARGERHESDDGSARDAFARLLDQAPASHDASMPVVPATTPVPEATHETAPADAKPASLPDQLLGLLASLAPGAQPAPPANDARAASVSMTAQPPAMASAATTAPTARTIGGSLGADAAAALLPTLQATGRDAATSATATASALAGLRTEETTASTVPTLRDGHQADTPAPTPFDALVRATAPTAADVPRPVVPATPTPVMQPTDPRAGYGEEFGTSVMWMADQRVSHAEVRVVPEHLGPIDVRLQLDGAQVHATFLSAQPDVRHALEASLPRLRDMLGQHGLQLAQADVGQRQQDPRAMRGGRAMADNRESVDDGLAPMTSTARARVVRGLLDEYA